MTAAESLNPAVSAVTDWHGVNFHGAKGKSQRWRRLLWSLVYPQRGHRVLPTVSGTLLILVALGIGLAAYNTASNILFITLSLLLACLVFSGIFSWFNLKGVTWRLRVTPPLRVGRDHTVVLELRNRKRVLPTYGLWFECQTAELAKPVRLTLSGRLDPLGEMGLEWTLRPAKRGRLVVEVVAVGSLFPFGFLKKIIGLELRREVLVWPAPVEYRRFPLASWRQAGQGARKAIVGQGGDLLALRPYAQGDSQRMVHWKASARLSRLMVRQFAAEMQEGFSLWVQTSAEVWPRPEQFELLCSFAATLAEDLFRSGRLTSVVFNDEPAHPVRSVRDLELFLDRLALAAVAVRPHQLSTSAGAGRNLNLLTFAPDGARGVIAHVDGKPAAST